MITLTVIILLCFFAAQDASGNRIYKYSRSVDTSQFTPQSPCPTIFQYQNDESGTLVGGIKVDRADQAGKVQLDVELSVGNSVQGYNGKITLSEDREKVINDIMNGKPIFYTVHFPPWQNIPPRVTKILVNGNQICSGSRIPIQMVPVLTTINLQHKLSLGVTPLISSSDGDSSPFDNFGSAQGSYEKLGIFHQNPAPSPWYQDDGLDSSQNFFLNGRVPGPSTTTDNVDFFNKNTQNDVEFDLAAWIRHAFNLAQNTGPSGQATRRGGNQNQQTIAQYPFDIRVDNNLPTLQNNIFTDNSGSRPESSTNPFLNSNNPYNFNPPQRPPPDNRPPPDRRPPPDDRWPPPNNRFPPPDDRRPPPDDRRPPPNDRRPPHDNRPPPDDSGVFSENPFLAPQAPGSSEVAVFGTRTTETPPVFTTSPPSRNGDLSYKDICGRPIATNSLIVNGQGVPRGAYPWLVAIFRQLDNLSLSYICSGSLISDRHVVTAAHCVKMEYRRVKPSEIVCVFGKLNIRKWVTVPGERMLEPEAIIVHPDYETGKANADIAVMTFQEQIPFNKMIRPVCLWEGPTDLNQVVGDLGIVVGWGRDENGAVSTAEPRQVNMPIVDQLECLKGSSSSVGQALVEIVSKNTFCAGFRNGSGPCNGDSGSAFLLRKNDVFYLRGIVSTALSEVTHKSCNLQEYVVFADASKYLDWLRRILRQN